MHNQKLLLIAILLFLSASGRFSYVLNFWGLGTPSIQATIPTADYYMTNSIHATIHNDYIAATFYGGGYDNYDSGGGYYGGSMKEKLSRYEGYRRCKYFDTKDIPTIGIGWNLFANRGVTGRLIGVTMPNCINDIQINTLYEYSVKRAERELYHALPWARNLPTGVRGVMIRMSFNMGMGNSERGVLSFQNTLGMLRRGDYRGAAEGFRHSAWYRDVGKRRGNEETAIIERGL